MTDNDIDTLPDLPLELLDQIVSARVANVINPRCGLTLTQTNTMFILAFKSVQAGERPTFDQLLADAHHL